MTRNPMLQAVSLVLAFSLLSISASADCPRTIAQLSYGPSQAVAVGGDFAAVNAGEVVVIVDLTSPEAPARMSELRLDEDILGLEWVGDALVASTWKRLSLIEVDATGEARLVHQLPMIQGLRHLAAVGSTLWTVDWNWSGGTMPTELTAFDLSVPAEPVILGKYSFAANATDLAVSGDLAFVADRTAGLRVLDISDVGDVGEMGSVAIADAWRVEVFRDLAVVATEWDGLTMVDVRLPSSPRVVGEVDGGRDAVPYSMRVRDGRLYVGFLACHPSVCPPDGGLSVFDVSDPTAPHMISDLHFNNGATDMRWLGERLVVADPAAGLRVISVADETAPSELGRLNPGLDEVFAVAVVGDHAILADRGLRVVDLSDGSNLTLVGELELDESAVDLAADHAAPTRSLAAYVGDAGTLSLIDLENPEHPQVIAELRHQQASSVALNGGRMAVADGDLGLWVLDLADPTEPMDLGHFPLPGRATAVAMSGDEIVVAYRVTGSGSVGILRFVADEDGGWWQASALTADRMVTDLQLAGDRLLAVAGNTLEVVDVSDRTTYEMVMVASLDQVYSRRLELSGPVLFLSGWPGTLAAVDLRDIAAPELTGRAIWQFPIADGGPQGGWDVASFRGMAVVADGEFGVRVMDAAACECARRDPADLQGNVD